MNLLRKPLLSLLALPIIISTSFAYKELNFLLMLLIFMILDLIFNYKIKNFTKYYLIVFSANFLIYSNYLYYETYLFYHDLRLRHFTLIYFIVVLAFLIIYKKTNSLKFHNVFILIFSVTLFTSLYLKHVEVFDRNNFLSKINYSYESPIKKTVEDKKNDSPLILIILDELSSSDLIYNYTKDSVDYKLDVFLKSKKYLVKSSFKSQTLRTSISLPSILNFNLTENGSVISDSIESLDKGRMVIKDFDKVFRQNILVDSLNEKSISSFSYGLVPFKKGINHSKNYYWNNKNPDHGIFSKLFFSTILGTLSKAVFRPTRNVDIFRRSSLEYIEDTSFSKNSFYYFHLFFPHDPFSYFDEYKIENINYLNVSQVKYIDEHIKYKRWFVEKFINLLDNKKFEDVRVIITGDHGFRYSDTIIDGSITSGYFKGFSNEIVNDINYVQDIGYLINESF